MDHGHTHVRRRTTSSVIRRSAPSRASIDGVRVEASSAVREEVEEYRYVDRMLDRTSQRRTAETL